jgi:hypothetical protein
MIILVLNTHMVDGKASTEDVRETLSMSGWPM